MNSSPHARLSALLRLALLTSTALVGASGVRAQNVVMGNFIISYGDSGPTDYFSVGAGSWDVKGGLLVGGNTDGDSPARLLIAPGAHFTTGSGGYIGHTLHPSEYFGAVSVDGGTWVNSGGLYVGDAGYGMLMISNGGTVTQEGGLGTVTIANQAGARGTLAIGLTRDYGVMDHGEFGDPGTLNAARVVFGQGDGKLLFHHSFTHHFGQEYTFAPSISGNGTIEQQAGTTRLGGNNSGFTGQVLVSGGRLILPTSSAIGSSVLKIDSASVELADGLVLSNPIEIYNDISTLHVPTGTAIQTGVISDFGSLNKSGTGTLVLAGANTFTGYVRLNEGTLEVRSDQSLGGSSGSRPPVFIQDGTTLRTGSNDLTLANDMWLVGNGTIDTQGHELTLSGKIGAAGGLIKSGSGLLRLTGYNTYAGSTTIREGTLAVEYEANHSGSRSPLVLAGGTLRFEGFDLDWLTPTTLVGTGGFEVARPDVELLFLKPLVGSGIFTKSGPGTLTLASNTFAIDRFDVQDGTLALGVLASLGPDTGLHLGAKGTFIHDQEYTTQYFAGGLLSGEAGSLYRIGSHSRLAITGPGDTTFSGSIADISEMFPYQVSGSLDKSGTGMLTLAGNNTYTGETQIMGGTLRLVEDGSIAASDWVNMHPTGTLELATGGKISLRGLSGAGGSVILSNTDLEVGTSGVDRSYNGSIRGTGGLIKAGAGVWTLGGPVSISGNLTVAGGTLDLMGAGSLSSSAIH
uniref:autotransporter-associated beta strand repeat-containing protein n=1 Tax=Microvirga roseola TaxID=2883126 RepID=UPI001E330A59